jgi:hypothetical protein
MTCTSATIVIFTSAITVVASAPSTLTADQPGGHKVVSPYRATPAESGAFGELAAHAGDELA